MKDSTLSPDLLNLIKPINCSCNGDKLIGYDGFIHFVKIDNDSIKNIDLKAKEPFFEGHWFGEPSADKKSEEIGNNFANVKLPPNLLQKTEADQEKVSYNINKFLSQNTGCIAFTLSKGAH